MSNAALEEQAKPLGSGVEVSERPDKGQSKRLIVNADGFGFGDGATKAILELLDCGGFVTSISVNPNFSQAVQVTDLVRRHPGTSVGIHLNPLVGRPCLPPERIPTLVDDRGWFNRQIFFRRLWSGKLSLKELKAELIAQAERILALVGEHVTHLDSQGNSHLHYFGVFLSVAKELGIARIRNNASLICLESPQPRKARARVYLRRPHVFVVHMYRRWQMLEARSRGFRMVDRLITVGYAGVGNKTLIDNWLRVLRNVPDGTYEIYCHPAYPDDTLQRWARYCNERRQELEVLRNSLLWEEALRNGVRLINYHQL